MKREKIYNHISENLKTIYLPLSNLLGVHISLFLQKKEIDERIFGPSKKQSPYVIGITGSVAVGKSTTARVLKTLLSRFLRRRKIELVATDSFLHPNRILKEKNLMNKKGFPESYNMEKFVDFALRIKLGLPNIVVPVYSHLNYDIVPDQKQTISNPDILIIEGLNILQNVEERQNDLHQFFISDFIDFSIYIDASRTLLQKWYTERFLKICKHRSFLAFSNLHPCHPKMSKKDAIEIAYRIWIEINEKNLKKHVLPFKDKANLTLRKSMDHKIERILLRATDQKSAIDITRLYRSSF